jgi:HAE1 family hydrophobic/amphiphilic exporter-1
VCGGLIVSQGVTLFVTPIIYLALDRWSGRGPIEGDELPGRSAPLPAK